MEFALKHSEKLDEIKSEGFIYEHKSGALLVHIKNNDKNKVFSATFRTPPKDNMGIPHIVEHTVLCGSKKYPIKDPFNELAKGSLYTFLNAMTFKDKTIYPIASCNDKDFYNLMDVYLDAVFNPLIHEKEGSFLQEGINYVFDDDGNFEGYGGIVYNEMQGAYSDPLEILYLKMEKELFSGTPYEFDSGGVPSAIKDITYEEFLKYYDEHYTPANCIFYLYGNVDIEKSMAHICEYLNDGRVFGNEITVKKAAPLSERRFVKHSYPADAKTSSKGMNYIGASFVINGSSNKLLTAVMIIKYYLLGLDSSPLKQALTDGGFGDEIIDGFDATTMHPFMSVIAKNSTKTAEEMAACIDNVINGILDNGFDEELLNACINRFEFSAREDASIGHPKGINYNLSVVTDIISGNFNFDKTNRIKPIEEIKNDRGYLTEVLREQFAANGYSIYITVAPDCSEEDEPKIDEETADSFKIKMETLRKYREMCDLQEDIDKIPMVKISDIDDTVEDISATEDKAGDVTVLRYVAETNGIVYADFMYGIEKLPEELMPYIGILTYVLGKLDTKNYPFARLQQQIGNDLGGFAPYAKSYTNVTTNEHEMLFVYKAKALEKNADKIFKYVKEVTEGTLFDNASRLKTLIKEYFSMYEDSIINSGQSFAVGRAQAYLRHSSLFDDYVAGVEFYMFLKGIVEKDNYDDVSKKLQEVVGYIFCKDNFKIYIANDKENYDFLKEDIINYANSLGPSPSGSAAEMPSLPKPGEAFAVRSNVQYAALVIDFGKHNIEFNGVMSVLISILNKNYLLDEVRIKGGAYGCNCFAYKKGLFCFSSYRDPNIGNTISAYRKAFDYAENLELSEKEMTKHILGTINKYLRPRSVIENVDYAITAFLNGIPYSIIEQEVQDVLGSNVKAVNDLGHSLKLIMEDGVVCVVGSAKKIEQDKSHFSVVYEV